MVPARYLFVSKCIGIIGKLLHSEFIEVAFNYFVLYRQRWRLLRGVKDRVHDDLTHIHGPDYMQNESALPTIVSFVLRAESSVQELGDSKLKEGARYEVKDFVACGAGRMILEHILPRWTCTWVSSRRK